LFFLGILQNCSH